MNEKSSAQKQARESQPTGKTPSESDAKIGQLPADPLNQENNEERDRDQARARGLDPDDDRTPEEIGDVDEDGKLEGAEEGEPPAK